MGVPDYKSVNKIQVDEFIKLALNGEFVMRCAPIEHYSQQDLKDLSEMAIKENLLMTIRAEYSNFYQGVLINLIPKKDVKNNVKFL